MGIFDFIKKTKKEEQPTQNRFISEPSIEITHTYSLPEQKTSSYQRINIVSDTELGKEVDEFLDTSLEAYNDSRLSVLSNDSLNEYQAIESQTKREAAIQYVLEKNKNNQEFLKNCQNYPTPYSYVDAIVTEMERIYSKTKSPNYDLTNPSFQEILSSKCTKDEKERNIDFYTQLVKSQANPRQKNNLHFGNFLNRYAKFIGREYQINTDPLELGKKYFEVFKNYKPYEESLDALKNECRKYRINYNEIFSEYGIVYANSFKEYYDCENRELLESSLATIIPIINQIKKVKIMEQIAEELRTNPTFIENSSSFGSPTKFIAYIMDQITEMYERTQNERLSPNSTRNIKVICTLNEEERNALFEKALSEAENKGIKK